MEAHACVSVRQAAQAIGDCSTRQWLADHMRSCSPASQFGFRRPSGRHLCGHRTRLPEVRESCLGLFSRPWRRELGMPNFCHAQRMSIQERSTGTEMKTSTLTWDIRISLLQVDVPTGVLPQSLRAHPSASYSLGTSSEAMSAYRTLGNSDAEVGGARHNDTACSQAVT
jgi:hypothetical protein